MTATQAEDASARRTQRIYARLAGFLFLWLIVNAIAGNLIITHIAGSGSFAETAGRVAESERLYRVGLSSAVLETLSSVLLAFALYATLKFVDTLLAQLAMIFSLQDAFLACLVRVCDFVRLHLYTSSQTAGAGAVSSQILADLMRSIAAITENVGGICFGIGSLLFFYLFFRSRYIPKILSGLGVLASAIWIALYFANLIFPEQHAVFLRICFPPMALADIATGVWLSVFSIERRRRGNVAVSAGL